MRPLPTGTVTLLFTDVEGSTRLLDELGADAYAAALQEHRRRLRDAFGARGGAEVDTQGDAFFYAFAVASEALAAAAEAQDGAQRPARSVFGWACTPATPTLTEEGYVGLGRPPRGPDRRLRPRRAGARLGRDRGARRARGAARPRRAPAQGSVRAGADLPARRRRVPAAQEPLPHEPAGPGDALPRPRARAGRGASTLLAAPDVRLADADRPGRNRQDAARAPGGRRLGGRLSGRRLVGAARGASRPGARPRRRRRRRWAPRTSSPSTSATRGCCCSSTTSSTSSRRRPTSPSCSRACPALDVLVTSREPLHLDGRARVPGAAVRPRRGASTSSSRGRGRSSPASRRTTRSPRSAGASTTSRSRSSSPRRA